MSSAGSRAHAGHEGSVKSVGRIGKNLVYAVKPGKESRPYEEVQGIAKSTERTGEKEKWVIPKEEHQHSRYSSWLSVSLENIDRLTLLRWLGYPGNGFHKL